MRSGNLRLALTQVELLVFVYLKSYVLRDPR